MLISPAPSSCRPSPLALGLCLAVLLAACSTPPPAPTSSPASPPPVVIAPPPPVEPHAPTPAKVSKASTERAYRTDGARHLYELNSDRIFQGKLPPLLHAVGVLQVELDPLGHVTHLHWMRAPHHVPEVMAEIERTVRAASPFPAAIHLGRMTYTETWLWDRSGRFQLDTLTEGQLLRSAPATVATPKPKQPPARVTTRAPAGTRVASQRAP